MNGTVLYCRTANGGMDVMEIQLETLLRYSRNMGYASSAAYCDCNESGITLDRPCLQRLLSDIRAGTVKRVIVKDLSRLARDLYNIHELIGVFSKYGVELISVNDGGVMDLGFAKELSDVFMSLAAAELLKRRKCG